MSATAVFRMSDKPKTKPKIISSENLLMWELGFTPEDLNANRAGHFSAHQLKNLQTKRKNGKKILGRLFLIVVVVGAGVVSILPIVESIVVLTVISVFYFSLSLWAIVEWRTSGLDVQHGVVEATQGIVELDIKISRYSLSYVICQNHKHWTVSKQAFLAFKNGDPYVIYYAPHTRTILSAEWLRESGHAQASEA